MKPLVVHAVAVALLAGASATFAQTAVDTLAGIAATQEAEKSMAGQARGVTKSAITAVFGGGAAPAAPAPAAAAPAPVDAAGWAAVDAQAAVPPAGEVPVDGEAALVAAKALADGRRDPFRPFTLDLQQNEVPDDVPLSPLQRFEIAQLRLTGLVLDLRTPRAMLQDASGMGYIITPGTPIGRRHGVVKSIEPGRVVVEESVLDYYGRQQLHQVVMEMPRDDKKDASSGGKP